MKRKESERNLLSHVYHALEPPEIVQSNNIPPKDIRLVYKAINDKLDRIDKQLQEMKKL